MPYNRIVVSSAVVGGGGGGALKTRFAGPADAHVLACRRETVCVRACVHAYERAVRIIFIFMAHHYARACVRSVLLHHHHQACRRELVALRCSHVCVWCGQAANPLMLTT